MNISVFLCMCVCVFVQSFRLFFLTFYWYMCAFLWLWCTFFPVHKFFFVCEARWFEVGCLSFVYIKWHVKIARKRKVFHCNARVLFSLSLVLFSACLPYLGENTTRYDLCFWRKVFNIKVITEKNLEKENTLMKLINFKHHRHVCTVQKRDLYVFEGPSIGHQC